MTVIYKNGRILTMCGATPQYASCLVTEGARIVHVGDLAEAGEFMARGEVREVDLAGQCLMPGLIDPHIHPSMAGEILTTLLRVMTRPRSDPLHGLDHSLRLDSAGPETDRSEDQGGVQAEAGGPGPVQDCGGRDDHHLGIPPLLPRLHLQGRAGPDLS